jgi:hypothetical protein
MLEVRVTNGKAIQRECLQLGKSPELRQRPPNLQVGIRFEDSDSNTNLFHVAVWWEAPPFDVPEPALSDGGKPPGFVWTIDGMASG